MKKTLSSFLLLVITVLFYGCKATSEVQTTHGLDGNYLYQTGDSSFPILLLNDSLETLLISYDTTSKAVTGCIDQTRSGEQFVIEIGDSAVPSRMLYSGYSILFSNYTDSTVDIAIVDTGNIKYVNNVN